MTMLTIILIAFLALLLVSHIEHKIRIKEVRNNVERSKIFCDIINLRVKYLEFKNSGHFRTTPHIEAYLNTAPDFISIGSSGLASVKLRPLKIQSEFSQELMMAQDNELTVLEEYYTILGHLYKINQPFAFYFKRITILKVFKEEPIIRWVLFMLSSLLPYWRC
jgi:hypothetical protein